MTKKQKKEPGKYDGMTLIVLETKIDELHLLSKESQKDMYEILDYLRTSGRYKENEMYARSNFWKYIEDRFSILEGTFRQNKDIFEKHPETAVKYGQGLIAKIRRKCGKEKTKTVLDQIEKKEKSLKKRILRNQIEEIIETNKKPENPDKIKTTISDWKSMYHRECTLHEKTKESLRDAMSEIAELHDQVKKLKKSAKKIGFIRDIIGVESFPDAKSPGVEHRAQ